ncbi:MAG: uroporphyrinogen-III C-methyltransferase [Gemmatimonadales bacterium]
MYDPGLGMVYLVGAGPGDPGLITVKGLEAVRAAQVVVFDRLVNPALVDEAPISAERIFVGKSPAHHAMCQKDINSLLIQRARLGLHVTRLKGGDPFVFGRGGEEMVALRQADVPFEIVQGVTSAVAVPAAAGIPVTDRNHSSAFAVVTGHESDGGTHLDWHALARIPTLVVLMGLKRLPLVTARLVACGANRYTPAAVIASGTLERQRTVVGTLGTISDRVRQMRLETPATLIVGRVVALHGLLVLHHQDMTTHCPNTE